jgi:hypothetical protein
MRVFIPLQRHPGFRGSGILFLNMFSPVLIEIHLYAGERKRRLRLGAGKLCSRWTKDPVVTGPRSRFSLGVVAPIPYAVDLRYWTEAN